MHRDVPSGKGYVVDVQLALASSVRDVVNSEPLCRGSDACCRIAPEIYLPCTHIVGPDYSLHERAKVYVGAELPYAEKAAHLHVANFDS